MTSSFPSHSRRQSYAPADDLWAEQMPECAAPDEAQHEELLLQKLGPRGWGRLHHFRHFYSQGWGELGRGRPLSPRALEAFFRFLAALPAPQGKPPSIFLTDKGNIELCWEDAAGQAVQVEFTPTGAEYFIEATAEEDTVAHAALADLAQRLGNR